MPLEDTPNAVEIARALLQAGAEPDALADMYGVGCTTMSTLVSSDHPAQAGLQVALSRIAAGFWRRPRRTRHQEMGRAALYRAGVRDERGGPGFGEARGTRRSARGCRPRPDGPCPSSAPLADAEARHRALA